MTISIGGIAIPSTMAASGDYFFDPGQTQQNGQGLTITVGFASVTWKWKTLTQSDYLWWCNTLLTGARSKAFASASLWNDLYVEQAFTQAIVRRPTFRTYKNAFVHDVELIIDHLA